MSKDRFETTDTGRGSKTHKEYLKKKIKQGLRLVKILTDLEKMSLKEINDRADILLGQVGAVQELGNKVPFDISLELDIIREVLEDCAQHREKIDRRKENTGARNLFDLADDAVRGRGFPIGSKRK